MFRNDFAVKSDRRISFLYAFWLNSLTWVFIQNEGQVNIDLELTLLAGCIPVFFQIIWRRIDYRNILKPLRFVLMFFLIISLSYLSNFGTLQPYASVFFFNIIYVMVIATLIGCSRNHLIIYDIAAFYAFLGSVLLVTILYKSNLEHGQRLGIESTHPNYIGLVGVSIGVCGIAFSRPVLRGICWVIVGTTIYLASSRTSMLAFMSALFVFSFLILFWRGYQYRLKLVIVCIFLFGAALCIPEFIGLVHDVILYKVFLIDDLYRGLGTGFTGRITVWLESLEVWKEAPLFGVGYRNHEYYLFSLPGTHNAYLAMLLDTGIIGLLGYLVFLAASIYRGINQIKDLNILKVSLGLILVYSIYGMFESRALNAGNAFSILFLIACFYTLTPREWVQENTVEKRAL